MRWEDGEIGHSGCFPGDVMESAGGGKRPFAMLKHEGWNIRRNLIIDAAERVFSQKAFNRASMREIANHAGISVASIYTYFENQEELFLEASLRKSERLIRELSELIDNDHMTISTVASAYIDFISNNHEYFSMVQHNMLYAQFTSGESRKKVLVHFQCLFEKIDVIISKYIASNTPRKYSHLLFAALNGILLPYRKLPDRSNDEALLYMKELACLLSELMENYQPK